MVTGSSDSVPMPPLSDNREQLEGPVAVKSSSQSGGFAGKNSGRPMLARNVDRFDLDFANRNIDETSRDSMAGRSKKLNCRDSGIRLGGFPILIASPSPESVSFG